MFHRLIVYPGFHTIGLAPLCIVSIYTCSLLCFTLLPLLACFTGCLFIRVLPCIAYRSGFRRWHIITSFPLIFAQVST